MASMPFSFAVLLDRPDIWRGDSLSRAGAPTIPCGFPGLDAELPGRGWPAGALTEILPAHEGIGELRLLGPALAGLSKRGLRLVLFAPPHLPHAPAPAAAGNPIAHPLLLRTGPPSNQPCLRPLMPPALRGKNHHVDRHPAAPAAARDFSARLVHA